MQQAHHFLINLTVENSAAVANFFEKLGFTELYPPVMEGSRLFSDGYLQIQLSKAEKLRCGVIFCTAQHLDSLAAELQLTGLQTAVQDSKVRVVAPDGLAVYYLHMNDHEFPQQPVSGNTRCGFFYELSLEVDELESSQRFWESLGFKKTLPEGDLSNWLSMSNGLLTVGLYERNSCPHPFHSPALTWFNPDARQKLKTLEEAGFKIAHVVSSADQVPEEAILESPEGHHLFLFKAW